MLRPPARHQNPGGVHSIPLFGECAADGTTRPPRRVAGRCFTGRCFYGGSRWVVGADGRTAAPRAGGRARTGSARGGTGPRGPRSRGVLTENGEACARGRRGGVGCGDAARAESDGDAGGCRGLEGGNGDRGPRGAGRRAR